MQLSFKGKTVLVTGASTGIGKATAIEFGKAGASVVVNYNSSKKEAEETAAAIEAAGSQALVVQADVSTRAGAEKLVQATVEKFGTINILVNNAGTLIDRRKIEEMDETLWDKVLDVNLKSAYLVTHDVLPIMRAKGEGNILNISSIAARNGGGVGAGHYAAAKAGMLAFTKNLVKELAGTNIRVNNIAPGIISTLYHEKFNTPEGRENYVATVPLRREGKPVEIAYACLFLASEYAAYITGETLEINGGALMD